MEYSFPETPCGWLMHHSIYHPLLSCLNYQNKTYTYREVQNFVSELADRLIDLGITSGSVVAVCCHSKHLLTGLIFAIPSIGCTTQIISPNLLNCTIAELLIVTKAQYLIGDHIAEHVIEYMRNHTVDYSNSTDYIKSIKVINVAALYAEKTFHNVGLPNRRQPNLLKLNCLETHKVQIIIATSGSEGRPKAVMLTGQNIKAAVTASQKHIQLKPQDRWLLCLPLYHIGGIAIIQRCVQAGATIIIAENAKGTALAAILKQQACTHISLVPAMLAGLLDVMDTPPPSLKYILIGGAALDPKLAQQALAQSWPIHISYGMTETCSQFATLHNPKPDWFGSLVGKPLPRMQVRINRHNKRIQVRGPALMAGYANPKLEFGHGIMADGWFETADLGYVDTEGQLWVQGRADYILVSGGVKVNPLQVEQLIQDNCPNITDIAISGRLDAAWGEILVAIFVGTATTKQIETWCHHHILSAMRPRIFIKVPRIPKTELGKIDRIKLRAIAEI